MATFWLVEPTERRRLIRTWLADRDLRVEDGQSAAPRAHIAFSRPERSRVAERARRLPHWELAGATYFVTFRVAAGLRSPFAATPPNVTDESSRSSGELVEEAVLFGIDWRYDLDAYVVMPDHVHLLLTPREGWSLPRILGDLKSVSAREVNHALGHRGSAWQDESFDHLVRDDVDWSRTRDYILHNPVVAGLVATPDTYPLSSAATLDPPGRREALRRLLQR